MPPLTITFDKMRLKVVHMTRENGGNVVATGEYDVLSSGGVLLASRFRVFTLTGPVQTTLNTLWDSGVTQINTLEGTTSAP